jgi:methylenetetrahydrofolate reductase (NADPH)
MMSGFDIRYELLPFGTAEAQATAVVTPLTLTVTCSPRRGVDRTLDFAVALARLGHQVVPHIAARMVRGSAHLDELLDRMHLAGIRDVFLVGGDARNLSGPYGSASELLPELAMHPRAPKTIGIPGYPEGHPFAPPEVLSHALNSKAPYADYIATQICFDPEAIRAWIATTRESGVALPIHLGVPGAVDRRRLLEVSARVGVGASISFLRKQHRLHQLLRHPLQATEQIATALTQDGDAERYGIAGFHFFTFNRLVETQKFVAAQAGTSGTCSARHRAGAPTR